MFDGGQPVLIAVLVESGATQPDDADRLTRTPRRGVVPVSLS